MASIRRASAGDLFLAIAGRRYHPVVVALHGAPHTDSIKDAIKKKACRELFQVTANGDILHNGKRMAKDYPLYDAIKDTHSSICLSLVVVDVPDAQAWQVHSELFSALAVNGRLFSTAVVFSCATLPPAVIRGNTEFVLLPPLSDDRKAWARAWGWDAELFNHAPTIVDLHPDYCRCEVVYTVHND